MSMLSKKLIHGNPFVNGFCFHTCLKIVPSSVLRNLVFLQGLTLRIDALFYCLSPSIHIGWTDLSGRELCVYPQD